MRLTLRPSLTREEGCESYRWDLFGQINILGDRLLSLEWARLIHVLHLFTEVQRRSEYFDQTVFDFNIDVSTLLNLLCKLALR